MNNQVKVNEMVQIANLEDLEKQFQGGKKLNRQRLINLLNFINFQDEVIILNFKHKKFNNIKSIKVRPEPCMNERLECRWLEHQETIQIFRAYDFQNFVFSDGKKLIVVKPDLKDISEDKIIFDLPESCYEFINREIKRYKCEGIKVEFIQNSIIFNGRLIDFNPLSFCVEIWATPPQTFHWINPEYPVNIILRDEQVLIYAGECIITKQNHGQKTKTLVLSPIKDNIARFKKKEIRSIRQRLSPSPHIVFKHPVTKKIITLEVDDISGSGFSVEESYENSVLLPGMIIPELDIEFAFDFKLHCSAQVIYRKMIENADHEAIIRCGIAFNPFGLGTKWPDDWEGRYITTNAEMKTYNINPVISLQLTPSIAIAGGLNFLFLDAKLENKINLPDLDSLLGFTQDGGQRFKGDGTGVGYNLGVLIEPHKDVSIGLSYRSKIKVDIDGRVTHSLPEVDPLSFPNTSGSTDITLPAQAHLGICYKGFDPLTLEIGMRWEGWSSYDRLKIKFDNPILFQNQLITTKNWKDTYSVNMGTKYQLNESVALLAGYLYSGNPVPDKTFEPSIPDANTHLFTLGTSLKHKRFKFDIAYGYQKLQDRNKDNLVGDSTTLSYIANGKYKSDLHMLGISLTYKF